MLRGAIYVPGFEPQFSGHETFPLRYSWLKKVYDAVVERASDPLNRLIFSAEDAISNFGVGKNMVRAMRYWALAARILEGSTKGPYRATALGKALFAQPDGWDPFIEDPATLWLIHWHLASNPLPATTIYFVFNHFHAATFYRSQLTDEIQRYCDSINYSSKIAPATLKRDVDCFLRTYSARLSSEEDSLDSLLAELSLIRPIGKQDGFVLARGAKPTLPDAVFLYGLISFGCTRGASRVCSVESLLHEPSSPGRIFLLDEEALLDRLSNIERLSRDRIAWSETAGLRQIIFRVDPGSVDLMKIAARAYGLGRAVAAV